MANQDPNYGAKKVKRRNRVLLAIVAGGTVIGGVIGFLIASLQDDSSNFLSDATAGGSLDPAIAIALAALLTLTFVGLPLFSLRLVDELEIRTNVDAMAIGGTAAVAIYPGWVVLAMGGLAPHPSALAMFAIVFAVACLAYTVLKIRRH